MSLTPNCYKLADEAIPELEFVLAPLLAKCKDLQERGAVIGSLLVLADRLNRESVKNQGARFEKMFSRQVFQDYINNVFGD